MTLDYTYRNFNNENPLTTLWTGICTIYEFKDKTDPVTKQTKQVETPVLENEPCRISYKSEQSTSNKDGVAIAYQSITLFIRPDLIIKPGSVIEVTQHGRTYKYKGSGIPAVYCNHQEVPLELYKNEV